MIRVVIPTLCYDDTIAFYGSILGFVPIQEADIGGHAFIRSGPEMAQTVIHIQSVDTNSEFAPVGHGLYLELLTSDIDDIKGRLRALNSTILNEWKDEVIHSLLVADPNGNLVLLKEIVTGEERRDSEFRPIAHVMMEFLTSLTQEMTLVSGKLIKQLRDQGLPDEFVEQIRQIRLRLKLIYDDSKQYWNNPAQSEEAEQVCEALYQDFRTELMALGDTLYALLRKAAQIPYLVHNREVQTSIGGLKGLIESIPFMPE